jgi:hypothetical protein
VYLDELCTQVPPNKKRIPADGTPGLNAAVESWFSIATTRASA